MWLLIIIIIIAGFILLSQFISRLEGENFRGLGKIITSERPSQKDSSAKDNALEFISGQNAPYFETMLLLTVENPDELLASWKISLEEYARAVKLHHASATDTTKAVLKLNYRGRLYFKEDYPVRLSQNEHRLFVNAAGCELFAELGFYTDDGAFFSLARSNTIIMPS